MKRSEALRSLSRDHHHALVAAQRLRLGEDVAESAAEFESFWTEHGRRHFQTEEEVLLPLWAKLGRADERAVARLALEHLRIRTMAMVVAEGPTRKRLQDLGDLLVAHVRFEERCLFDLIERDLGAAELIQLADAVARAEAGERGS